MRYFEVDVKSDDSFRETYYVEIDNLISEMELNDYVVQIAAVDMLMAEDDGEELEIVRTEELLDVEMIAVVSDVTVRSKLVITSLNDISNVVLGIYKREKDFNLGDPEFFIFSAAAGQDSDITSIGRTEDGKTREEVIQEGWNDCIYQCKKYFQIPGVVIATGLFTIQSITEDEFDMERSERELVLV